jgi:hypothetical protein
VCRDNVTIYTQDIYSGIYQGYNTESLLIKKLLFPAPLALSASLVGKGKIKGEFMDIYTGPVEPPFKGIDQ